MPFRERETSSLLNNDQDYDYRIRKEYLTRFNWKSLLLAICAALIPLLLWIAIFQHADDPAQQLLAQSDSSGYGLLPTESHNLQKVPEPQQKNQNQMNSKYTSMYSKQEQKSKYMKSSNLELKRRGGSPATPSSPFNNYPTISSVGNITVFTYSFVVSENIICPDNYEQKGFLINGQSPGPEIRIKQHSILIVHVENRMTSDITFHFHGIHQRKSFLSDGVPNVTQKPITPGSTFTYEIDTWPQVGTFFYHAHTAMDIVWLFGPLVIEDDPVVFQKLPEVYQTDADRVLILNGVYHEQLDDLVDRIAGPVHNYPTLISSITFNGRSFGLWGENETMATEDQEGNFTGIGYYVTSVKKGLNYRFRFINAASDSLLSCQIDGHSLIVIETDGIYVSPIASDHLVLSPGQRYSVTVKMDQPAGNYYIRCQHMESSGPMNGLSILHYEDVEEPSKELLMKNVPGTTTLEMDPWIIDRLSPNFNLNQTDVYAIPKRVDQEFVIDVFEAVVGQRHVYLINGHYFEEPSVPYFMQLRQNKNISELNQVFEILEGETVQFVFQNQRTGDFCFSHPWHIHGHSFHVVGQGSDRYDPVKDGQRIQKDIESGTVGFQFRDSVTVYANQTIGEHTDGAFCGWAAVRFSAHNPGLWLAHCHVTPHMIMGKKFVIWEHPRDDPYLKTLMDIKKRG